MLKAWEFIEYMDITISLDFIFWGDKKGGGREPTQHEQLRTFLNNLVQLGFSACNMV